MSLRCSMHSQGPKHKNKNVHKHDTFIQIGYEDLRRKAANGKAVWELDAAPASLPLWLLNSTSAEGCVFDCIIDTRIDEGSAVPPQAATADDTLDAGPSGTSSSLGSYRKLATNVDAAVNGLLALEGVPSGLERNELWLVAPGVKSGVNDASTASSTS